MKWYKHFSKAHRDTKIKRLINDFGSDGYAVYFYCLELIADSIESDNVTFELEDDAELVGQFLKIDTLRIEKIMHRCIDLGLFGLSEAGRITCFKMAKFLDEKYTRNPILKKMIKSDKMVSIKGEIDLKKDNFPSLSETVRDKMETVSECPREIRLDKIRIDKNIREEDAFPLEIDSSLVSKRKNFVKPTKEEAAEYMRETGITSFSVDQFFDHYESNGWMIGKNKMKDWRATVRNWSRRQKDKKETRTFRERNAFYDTLPEEQKKAIVHGGLVAEDFLKITGGK